MIGGCDDIRARLNDLLDNELSAGEHERIQAHLRECAACREFFARYETLQKDLSVLARAADRIAARPVAAGTRARHRWPPIRAAAVVLLAAGIGSAAYFMRPSADRELIVRDEPGTIHGLQLVDSEGSVPDRVPGDDAFHLNLADKDDRLAVRMATENPRVHIVWLYGDPPADESTDDEAIDEGRPRSESSPSAPIDERRFESPTAVLAAANL